MFEKLRAAYRAADIVKKFIYINVAVYIILVFIAVFCRLFNEPGVAVDVKRWFELPASVAMLLRRPWTLFTYMFLHADVMHILWNMFALYVFGGLFLNSFSVRHFVGTYLLGGVAGALFFVLAYNIFPYFADVVNVSYLVGASASVLAIVAATAVRSPNCRINLLLIGSVKLSTFGLITVLISLFMLSGSNAGGNFAHIGGAAAGALFALMLGRGVDFTALLNGALDWVAALAKRFKRKRQKGPKFTAARGGRASDYEYNARKKASDDEVDRILEKIKRGGYASLSDEEKRRLFDASSRR